LLYKTTSPSKDIAPGRAARLLLPGGEDLGIDPFRRTAAGRVVTRSK
jgi:hypothetical protein